MKPEVVLSVSALRFIRSAEGFKGVVFPECAGPDPHPTNGAYEADE